jgi:hypothetical protein
MLLRLTVRDFAARNSHDVEVTPEPASTVASPMAALSVRETDTSRR